MIPATLFQVWIPRRKEDGSYVLYGVDQNLELIHVMDPMNTQGGSPRLWHCTRKPVRRYYPVLQLVLSRSMMVGQWRRVAGGLCTTRTCTTQVQSKMW